MRFYRIEITTAAGKPVTFKSLGGRVLSSLNPDGSFNPACLQVEFDLPVAPLHEPAGQVFLKIHGLGLADLGSAFNLNNLFVSIYGGMSAGLPLANPSQARLLVKGQIFQAFGNWVGVEQTVDMILTPAVGTTSRPINYTLNWTAGTTLASALQSTLSAALPKATLDIKLSPRLSQNHDEIGVYGTLSQLAMFLNPISKKIITDARYTGVHISYDGATVKVWDLSTQPPPTAIAFQDLIGQVTWIAPNVIQAKCVLRGDLDILGTVTLPPSLVTNTAAAMSSLSGNPANLLTFSGNYTIKQIHHYGNSRQHDAGSWNTTLDMFPTPPPLA